MGIERPGVRRCLEGLEANYILATQSGTEEVEKAEEAEGSEELAV